MTVRAYLLVLKLHREAVREIAQSTPDARNLYRQAARLRAHRHLKTIKRYEQARS